MKLFSTIFILLFGLTLNAQVKIVVDYKLTINDNLIGKRIQNYIVYISKLKSIEFIKNSEPIASKESNNEVRDVTVISDTKPYFLLKDFSSKKIILSNNINVKRFLIKDTLNQFEWNLTKEKKKIGNFNCKKASTNFRGRNYIAWYAEDIPIQNGPWKFCGLPGLIVNIYDDKFVFNYELTGIDLKPNFDKNIISLPKDYFQTKPITHKEFIVLFNKKLIDYQKLSRVDHSTKNYKISNLTIALPEKQEKF